MLFSFAVNQVDGVEMPGSSDDDLDSLPMITFQRSPARLARPSTPRPRSGADSRPTSTPGKSSGSGYGRHVGGPSSASGSSRSAASNSTRRVRGGRVRRRRNKTPAAGGPVKPSVYNVVRRILNSLVDYTEEFTGCRDIF